MQNQQAPLSIEPIDVLHFLAIYSELQSREALQVTEVAAQFTEDELRAWLRQLTTLDIPQAVQHIRVLVAGNTEAVS
jgi:hypothetical protein